MRIASFAVFVLLILSLTISILPTALLAQQKPPVPAAELQESAKKAATEIYGGRFRQAKTAAEKTALATEMIEAATKVQDGSPDQYVLLKIAADIAATAGDAPTALQAVEKMAERFDVPGPKLTAETLLAAAGNATMTSQHKAVAEAALKIADAVAGAEEYALALTCANWPSRLRRRPGSTRWSRSWRPRSKISRSANAPSRSTKPPGL